MAENKSLTEEELKCANGGKSNYWIQEMRVVKFLKICTSVEEFISMVRSNCPDLLEKYPDDVLTYKYNQAHPGK